MGRSAGQGPRRSVSVGIVTRRATPPIFRRWLRLLVPTLRVGTHVAPLRGAGAGGGGECGRGLVPLRSAERSPFPRGAWERGEGDHSRGAGTSASSASTALSSAGPFTSLKRMTPLWSRTNTDGQL